ncbi:MAG: S49 family peptidase [Planctomycetes bacterium]|nr:S49 family peptidase [Planctomycetota bacterium]
MLTRLLKALTVILAWQISSALILLSLLMIAGVLFFGSLAVLMRAPLASSGISNEDQRVAYSVVDGRKELGMGNIIVEIPMKGNIARGNSGDNPLEAPGCYERILSDLDKISADDRVRAVIIRVNSPGGSVTDSDYLHYKLKSFRDRTHLPLYAFYESVAASGGVYSTACANVIMASPTCITGSIGVIMGAVDVKEFLGKIGVNAESYTSGRLKDMSSIFRKDTEEEEALFRGMIEEMFDRFLNIVVEGRGTKVDRDQIIALQGSFFLPEKAKSVGLIDEIGQIDELYERIRKDLSCPEVPIVQVRQRGAMGDILSLLSAKVTSAFAKNLSNTVETGLRVPNFSL